MGSSLGITAFDVNDKVTCPDRSVGYGVFKLKLSAVCCAAFDVAGMDTSMCGNETAMEKDLNVESPAASTR